jgi:hypothetical protein
MESKCHQDDENDRGKCQCAADDGSNQLKTQPGTIVQHYKNVTGTEFLYQVLGIAHLTEEPDFERAAHVIYRPLYKSAKTYVAGQRWDARPLSMFLGSVVHPDTKQLVPRFKVLTDEAKLQLAKESCREMYHKDFLTVE